MGKKAGQSFDVLQELGPESAKANILACAAGKEQDKLIASCNLWKQYDELLKQEPIPYETKKSYLQNGLNGKLKTKVKELLQNRLNYEIFIGIPVNLLPFAIRPFSEATLDTSQQGRLYDMLTRLLSNYGLDTNGQTLVLEVFRIFRNQYLRPQLKDYYTVKQKKARIEIWTVQSSFFGFSSLRLFPSPPPTPSTIQEVL